MGEKLTDRPDLEPGFWPNYQEPTAMARAIQMPLHPAERWIDGVLSAYAKRKPAGRAALAREEGR